MTCSAASTLTPTAAPALLPAQLPTTRGAWQRVRTSFQQLLQLIQGAGGSIGNNVVPQQYALLAGSTLPPISALSNCTVALDAATPLFGAGGSYKISITGSPATITLSVPTAWPISPNWQWIVSFFQRASAAISGAVTITTPAGSYATDFTTTLTASGWKRLYDALNLGADGSSTFGLSFTFTGGAGQTVWLDGLMLEAYFNVVIQPSPFMSTSSPLTLDNQPDGPSYVRLLGNHAAGNVAYNYRGVWSSATSYVIGDEVLYGNSYWIATAASTNSAPPSANWQVVGSYSAFLGAWSSITTYAIGAEVTYAGNFWLALAQNSNSAPSVSNANWQIAGPASLDDVADGVNRFAGIQAAATGDGFQILSNPDFAGGSLAGYSIYDNNGSGKVSLIAVADATAPNSSGYKMEIQTASGTPSPIPGLGGFYLAILPDTGAYAVNTYHKGSTIIWRIRANIPIGYAIGWASNAFGNEGVFNWLTSQAGTGGWFDYVGHETIGTTGIFSSTGFFYLVGTAPVTWYVAACSAVCVSFPQGVGLPPANVDGNRRALIDFGQGGHLGKSLANIADGAARFAIINGAGFNGVASIDGNNRALIDFTQGGHLGKTLDNLPNGAGRFAVISIDGNGRAIIDFTQGAHLGKTVDNIGDGANYGRTLGSGLSGGYAAKTGAAGAYNIKGVGDAQTLVLDNEIVDGTDYVRMPSPPATCAAGGQALSQVGTSTQISVAAGTYYLGNKVVSVNAGSVDPGVYNTYWVYFDDPGFAGGAVTYQLILVAPGNYVQITANPYRFYVGSIGTSAAGGAVGGGTRGPCFSGDTRIRTPYGYRRFDELPERFEIVNRTGRCRAALLKHHEEAECRSMGPNHLVTAEHRIRVGDLWLPARELFYDEGPKGMRDWYNLHVFSDDPDDHHYILENGLTAHNPKP